MSKEIAIALRDCFISPNVRDSNGEAANIVDSINFLKNSVSRISHGGVESPLGLEALAMAITGHGDYTNSHSLAGSLDRISSSIDTHADAMNRIADAIEELSKKGDK